VTPSPRPTFVTTRALPLLVLLAALTSCAQAAAPGSGGGGATSTHVPAGSGPITPAPPKIVTPRSGLVHLHAIPWRGAVPSTDGTELTVSFWGSPCFGIDHATVDEAPSTVTVTLYQGMIPSMVNSPCPQIVLLEAVRVSLSTPLNGRKVVDGARSQTHDSGPSASAGSVPGPAS